MTAPKIFISERNVSEVIYSYTLPDSVAASLLSFNATPVSNPNLSPDVTALSFFEASIDENIFTIQTTDKFASFGENVHTDGGVAAFVLLITLNCDGTAQSQVDVTVTDTFSRELAFSNPSGYSYSLPMPIMPKTDISAYGELISVYDVNFSNEQMSFSIAPEDFEVTTVQLDERKFKALLNPVRILQFDQSQIYTLTAVDSGNQTQIVEITIAVNASAGFDSPQFSSSYYSFSYSIAGQLTANDGDIAITSLKPDEASYQLEGEWASSFQVVFDNSTQQFTLSNSPIVLPNLPAQILLTLSFTTDVTTETVLIIDVEHLELMPAFSSLFYQGTYDPDSNSISLDPEIELQNAESVTLSDAVSDRLTIDQRSYAITSGSVLAIDDFDQYLKLVFAVTATSATLNSTSAVVALSYVKKASLHFDSPVYSAEYSEAGAVTFASASHIGFEETTNFSAVEIAVDAAFSDNFKVVLDGSEWAVTVQKNLSAEILDSQEQLIVPITATMSGLSASALLVLQLPTQRLIQFSNLYYSALYSVKDTGTDSIKLNEVIAVTGADSEAIAVSFGEYGEYFTFNTETNEVDVVKNLDTSPLVTPFIVVLTACITSHPTSNATSLLVVDVETTTSQLQFVQKHYSAEYKSGTVELADKFIQLQNDDNLQVDFAIEDYESYLKLVPNAGSYTIQLLKNLNASEQTLIINIMASTTSGDASGSTVLVLNVPAIERSLKFDQQYYTGSYSAAAEPSIKLDDYISLTAVGYSTLKFSLGDFDDYFALQSDSEEKSYRIKVNSPLEDSVLSLSTELFIVLTAQDTTSGDNTSSVLILKLPLYTDEVFDSNYYEAEYVVSADGTDSVRLLSPILVKKSAYTQLTVPGYESYLSGSCDATSFQCAISVDAELNSSTLVAKELLLTLTASNEDQSSTGKAVLLLQLPTKNASLQFTRQVYSAQYTIEKSATDLGTLVLFETIAVEGSYSDDISITSDLPNYLEFALVSSTWTVTLLRNFPANILAGNSTLIVALTAQQGLEKYGTAVLAIQLPDKSAIAFSALSYVAEYVLDDTPHVVLETAIETSQAEYSQIVLNSFGNHFELRLEDPLWTIETVSPLNSSILSQFSELQLQLTILKVGVSYGEASLVIKLPSFSFSQGVYSATYTVDANSIASVSGDAFALANANPDYIQLKLAGKRFVGGFDIFHHCPVSDYSAFFYTEAQEETWSLKLQTPLPADITQNHRVLVTNLVAERQSDGVVLATASLVINLPNQDSDEAPKFSNFAYFGEYLSTDPPAVQLRAAIEFANDNIASISNVAIDSYDEYSRSFRLVDEGSNRYSIEVAKALDEDVLADNSSIVLTLLATSTQDLTSAAALVIALPKLVRNASIQVENQEVLFTANYTHGSFTSPKIVLHFANDTEDADVSVEITNDLGIDNAYFHYTCSGHVLTIDVDELPEEVLNGTSMVALKLAITDRNTNDTIYAVVAVDIATDSAEEGASYAGRTALIVAVSLLAVLLLLLLLAVFLYWFCVLRRTKQADFTTKEEIDVASKTTIFTKREAKKPNAELSQAALRRPTGLPAVLPQESLDNHASYADPDPEKTVGFDDNVEKIDNPDEDGNEKLRSVADRRPTKFVFGHPLEAGVLDPIADIPEERRRSLDLPDDKKKVAFDVENVERMDFEPVEEQDEEEETEGTRDSNVFKAEAQLKINADDAQLPSQVFKEIF
ncbi:hypothetical protein YQE_04013, partial [Dendroctonus ponderosae]